MWKLHLEILNKGLQMINLTIEDLQYLNKLYGDGFYILDSEKFVDNFNKLKQSFQKYYENFNIAYSYKTNYLPKLCKLVDMNGGFSEIVSEMELQIALKCGVKYKNIIWNGPIKKYNILDKFLLNGGTANIDNIDEWNHIVALSEQNKNSIIHIGIRCNFDVGDSVISRFGIDVDSDDFKNICLDLSSKENIKLLSIQCHFAKRNSVYWKKRTEGMLEIYEKLKSNYGIIPERMDLGGALRGKMSLEFAEQIGIKNESELEDYNSYAELSAKIVAEHFKNSKQKPLLLIEPGTALAADCMKVAFKVMNIKTVKDKSFATVYGSQKNISMQGINPPLTVIHNNNPGNEYSDLDFAGYTCIESDYLYHGYNGKLAVGDYIILEYCGSYSIVMKPPFIFPNFPIIDICEGVKNSEVIKRGETFEDLFNTYNF